MHVRRMRRYWLPAVLFVLLTLASAALACRQAALRSAMQACNRFHVRQLEQPVNIHVHLTTYGRAIEASPHYPSEVAPQPQLLVWLVEMQGRWAISGPPPPVGQPPVGPDYDQRCAVILDVFTFAAFQVHTW